MEEAEGNAMKHHDGEHDRFMRDCLRLPIVGSGKEADPDIRLAGPETERRMARLILGLVMVGMGRRRMPERTGDGQDHDRDVQDRDDPARHLQRWPVLWTDHHTGRELATERASLISDSPPLVYRRMPTDATVAWFLRSSATRDE